MRFPWLQVDTDFIDGRAAELGARLGVSRREAAGLALDLWKWVLSRSPDDRPPEGYLSGTGAVPVLMGVLGWTGDHEHLMSALVAVGLVEILPTGLRVRGLSRYRTTWEKNRRRTTGTKPDRSRTGAGAEPEPKTYTQTQKEEDPAAQVEPAVAVPPAAVGQATLLAVPVAERPKRPPTSVSQWAEAAAQKRKARVPADAPLDELKRHQWPKLGEALKAHGALTLNAALDLYLAAPDYPQEHAYPLGLFISQVNEWVSRAQAAAAKARLQSPSGGDRPRLPPRESPPESTNPATPSRRVIL